MRSTLASEAKASTPSLMAYWKSVRNWSALVMARAEKEELAAEEGEKEAASRQPEIRRRQTF